MKNIFYEEVIVGYIVTFCAKENLVVSMSKWPSNIFYKEKSSGVDINEAYKHFLQGKI